MRRRAGVALLVAAILASCALFEGDDEDAVFPSAAEAVEAAYEAPQYAIQSGGGLRVQRGGAATTFALMSAVTWLNDGRLLARLGHPRSGPGCVGQECWRFSTVVVDATGDVSRARGVPSALEWPGQGRWAVNLFAVEPHGRLFGFAPDLTTRTVTDLPPYDGPEGYTQRDYSGGHTVGDATYVRFSDTINEERTEEYGYLRIRDGEVDKVLVEQRIVALWVSDDGRALLGLQQRSGTPCGGCVVEQQVVEIDPESGEIAATYGVPDDYEKDWRVDRIDKTGDTIAVRYEGGCGAMPCAAREFGVWTYDGDWSMVEGSDRVRTWWQGPQDRIELRHGRRLADARLVWVSGERETELDGRLLRRGWLAQFLIPGSLLPPVE